MRRADVDLPLGCGESFGRELGKPRPYPQVYEYFTRLYDQYHAMGSNKGVNLPQGHCQRWRG